MGKQSTVRERSGSAVRSTSSEVQGQPLNPDDVTFRRALGSFITGVTVVTTSIDGIDYGMTASSLASVSTDPPSLLVCLNVGSVTQRAAHDGRHFTVNVLTEEQRGVAHVFSRPNGTINKFAEVETEIGLNGVRYVVGALASMECTLTNECIVGTHSILVGRIDSIRLTDGKPLAYFQSGFGAFEAVG